MNYKSEWKTGSVEIWTKTQREKHVRTYQFVKSKIIKKKLSCRSKNNSKYAEVKFWQLTNLLNKWIKNQKKRTNWEVKTKTEWGISTRFDSLLTPQVFRLMTTTTQTVSDLFISLLQFSWPFSSSHHSWPFSPRSSFIFVLINLDN